MRTTEQTKRYVDKWRTEHREHYLRIRRAQFKRYRANPDNLLKIQARRKVQNEIKRGRITKGTCEVCGSPHVEAHHEDYTKPLEVRWFCSKHHKLHERT